VLSEPHPLVTEIVTALRLRYKSLNPHYEAAWTESWSHRRCLHEHPTLTEAAKCATPHGAGWYVFAVESSTRPNAKKARIPDVCNQFGVKCIDTLGMLKELKAHL
jgi:uncharacterized protein DUF4411